MKKITLLFTVLFISLLSQAQSSAITSFTLVDAQTNSDLMEITDGMEIDLLQLPENPLSIIANGTGQIGSVRLEMTGALTKSMTENVAPYALYGDSGGNYGGQEFIPGNYSLTARPYSESDLGGSLGVSLTVQFRIIEGVPQRPFITTWKTNNPGISGDNQIKIRTSPSETYNYTIHWGDGNSDTNVTGDITHTYAAPGIYSISISGNFPSMFADGFADLEKLLTVDQWGDIIWESMEQAFASCINLDIVANDVPNLIHVTSMQNMFNGCTMLIGNEVINQWDVSKVTNMNSLFKRSGFDLDISNWDVSNVTNLGEMFRLTSFNQDIGNWDVSSVEFMNGMFDTNGDFDQDIGNWNVGNVRDLSFFLSFATSFNQNISGWNVGNVLSMNAMFQSAISFNQDIGNWDISNVEDMSFMLNNATSFDQDLGNWDVSKVNDMEFMFGNATLSVENYDSLLNGWSNLSNLQSNVLFDAGKSQYCAGEGARQSLIDIFNWTIADNGENCQERPFISTWKTDNPGISEDNQIRIPTRPGYVYDYRVDWGDGNISENVTGDISHTYDLPGTYQVSVSGIFPSIFFGSYPGNEANSDSLKLIEINQWGDIVWKSMLAAFAGCTNMDLIATDVPDLTEVDNLFSMFHYCESMVGNDSFNSWDVSSIRSMSGLFTGCSKFNQNISAWDVSNVENMFGLFSGCRLFNQNISGWDVSNVSTMQLMFSGAIEFNQPIGGWNVSNVEDMIGMFQGGVDQGHKFNQDIGSWNVSNVKSMGWMFAAASVFNQDLSEWDIAKVTDMRFMFSRATSFNQNLGPWNIVNVMDMTGMFFNVGIDQENYDGTLKGWNEVPNLQSNVTFNAGNSQYCNSESARQNLISNYGWTITDGGLNCSNTSLSVTNMLLVNSDTNQDIMVLTDGLLIDVNTLPTMNLTIRANVTTDVESVQLSLTGAQSNTRTENVAPYALFGDNSGDYFRGNFTLGTYSLNVIPFSEDNLGGDTGLAATLNFEFVEPDNSHLFITTWKTDNPGTSGNNQITIPTFPGESYNYSVDWGDDTTTYNLTGSITKTYSTPGIYTVSISGDFPRIFFNSSGDNQKILTIEQWGSNTWSSMENAFSNCPNLDVLATDIPDLSSVTSTNSMFAACFALVGNPSFNNWDVSNVTNMQSMFDGAYLFDQPIGFWDVSNVTNMISTFQNAPSFNQDIGNWDVSNVTTMDSMFEEAPSFNQDISRWDVSNVTDMKFMFETNTSFNQDIGGWDVSNVMDMSAMFEGTNFNQDISNWDVSNVINMRGMFASAVAFDQDLGDWDISQVDNMENMFVNAGLSTENYDTTLIGWNTLGSGEAQIPQDIVFNGGNSQFCLGEAERQNLIETYGWTITDGGINCGNASLAITGFVLVDADTNLDIMPVVDGKVIDLSTLPSQNLNIRANATADVESVLFELIGGQPNIRTENVVPYALYGDNAEDYFGNTFVIGTYSLTATPFSGNNQGGNVGAPMSVSFELVNNQTNTFDLKLFPNPTVTEVTVSMENPDVAIRGIMIHDVQGKVLVNYSTGELSKGDTYTLPITEFPAGVYYMSVINDTGIVGRKLLMVKK